VEIKALELLVDRVRRADLVDRSVDLQVVVVHNHAEVIQLAETCEHGSLPDLSLLDLAVAAKCIHTVILLFHLPCQSHAARCGKSLSQRTGRHIHARNVLHIRMSL